MEKAYMTQRLFARVIDIIIVVFATTIFSFITSPIINNNAIEKLNNELMSSLEKYQNKEISINTYINQSNDISYQLEKLNGLNKILSIIFVVVYYIIYQVYKNGQTIGRKIMKIKVVKIDDSELTINDMLLRELFNNGILVDIFLSILILFGKDIFIKGSYITILQMLFMIITIFMILIRKDGRGLPDIIAKTEVINYKEVK